MISSTGFQCIAAQNGVEFGDYPPKHVNPFALALIN